MKLQILELNLLILSWDGLWGCDSSPWDTTTTGGASLPTVAELWSRMESRVSEGSSTTASLFLSLKMMDERELGESLLCLRV